MKFEGDLLTDNTETEPFYTSSVSGEEPYNPSPAYFSVNTRVAPADFDLHCINHHQLCPLGFTLSFWILVDSSLTSDLEILSLGDCASSRLYGNGFCVFYEHAAGTLVFVDVQNGTVKEARCNITPEEWVYLAFVYDPTVGEIFYMHADTVIDFVTKPTKFQPMEMIYLNFQLGNWHSVMLKGSHFKLHDVRFQSRPPMSFELHDLSGE